MLFPTNHNFIMMFSMLPDDIKGLIYEYDSTYHLIYKNLILSELQENINKFYCKFEIGYSIRNYMLRWVVTPRYYDKTENKMNGVYIRNLQYYVDPL